MKLYTTAPSGATLLQNTFIDRYMVHANGEFVKVYIYLLRCAASNQELTLSSVADVLEYTEKDLLRALSYWEKLKLLRLSCDADGTICEITFTDIAALQEQPDGLRTAGRKAAPAQSKAAARPSRAGQKAQPQAGSAMPDADRMQELKEQADIRQLFFVAEQYLQRPLSSSEQEELLYYFDSLHFSVDLIEYLLEYCISKGSASRHYMRRVALAWAEAGITTVTKAREETNLYNKNYFSIMNAFGIKGRNPAAPELEVMSRWINELEFTLDIILEACRRTIQQTHQPNFQYANKILEQWKKQGVRSCADIVALDQKHRAQQQKEKEKAQQSSQKQDSNRFNKFNQRDYNYSQFEQRLLHP